MVRQTGSSGHGAVPSSGRPLGRQVRQILLLAGEEAKRLNHGFLGNEHLALGILTSGCRVGIVLERLGFSPDGLRSGLLAEKGEGELPPEHQPRLSPHGDRSLAFAADEAKRAARATVGADHLLLGIARDESLFGGALAVLGLRTEAVREAIRRQRPALVQSAESLRADPAALLREPLASVRRAQASVYTAVDRALRRGQKEMADRLRTAGDALQEVAERLSAGNGSIETG